VRVAAFDEPLEGHLKEVGGLSKHLIRKLRLGLSGEAWLAGLLHDLGKALSPYQPLLREKGKAPGHEICSALIISMLPDDVFISCTFKPAELRAMTTYVALMHHQAIAPVYERISMALNFIRNRLRRWTRDADVKYMDTLLRHFLKVDGLRETLKRAVELIEEAVSMPKLLNEHISNAMKPLSNTILLYKARMLTGAVMMADTYVAMTRRGGKPLGIYKAEITRLFKGIDAPSTAEEKTRRGQATR